MTHALLQQQLQVAVTTLPKVGERVAAKLQKLGISTVRDLITHWPRRWEDYSRFTAVREIRRDQRVVVRGTLHNITLERRRGKRLVRVEATLRDAAGDELPVVWFNQAYLARALREGGTTTLAGTTSWDWYRKHVYLPSPRRDVEPGIVPIYPETEGVSSRLLHALITPLLPTLELPDPVSSDQALSLVEAIRRLHQPSTLKEAEQARTRLALDEHLLLQYHLALGRAERLQQAAAQIEPPITALRSLVASLPFQLTDGQRRAAWTVMQRLGQSSPTRQLLQGDVGSGKTLVALLVALAVLEAGYHVIWLVPTHVLASQLTQRLSQHFDQQRHNVTLVAPGALLPTPSQPTLFVGTHTVLDRRPPKTGLVVIDEQQRFGVDQRETVLAPIDGLVPHALMMSATPIPRSLALAILGQEELVTLPDRPGHQQPVSTKRCTTREEAFPLIQSALDANQQVFVVVPRIDGVKETLFAQTLAEVERSYQRAFPAARTASLHGRLDQEDQSRALELFVQGDADILVATTMVEVGIDVPNATVMVIEEADRFGLAQLHQLRGRVGRGTAPGTCVVCTATADEFVTQRLSAFVQSNDGFALAEFDLQFRGPGELLGTIQSGLPELRLATLDDTLAIDQARAIAGQWLAARPAELEGWLAFHQPRGRGNESLDRVDSDQPGSLKLRTALSYHQ